MNTRKLLESFRQIEEDEYGRDQGALNDGGFFADDLSEDEFFYEVANWEHEEDQQADSDPRSIELDGNTVIHNGSENLGTLSSHGGQMILMHGAAEGRGDELLGAIVHDKGMNGFNVFHYQSGYVGNASTIEGAVSALTIAAYG